MAARVIHFEIHADDPERCAAFYRDVFGWEIQQWDGPIDYWLAKTGPGDKPGIDGAIVRRTTPPPSDGQPLNSFTSTLEVEDIERTEREVTAAGGEQVVPREDIPGVGRVSYFKDTEGNIFGALEPPS
jgi:predicted enzyme related to lactoylglutathione lyase